MQNFPGYNPQLGQSPAPSYPTPGPPEKTKELGLDYNIAGLLCYVPFGFLAAIFFLVTEPKHSHFVRFHAVQSLILGGALTVLSIALSMVSIILGRIPVVGFIISIVVLLVFLVLSLAGLALMVLLILKAYQKQMWQIPLIGSYAHRIATSQQ